MKIIGERIVHLRKAKQIKQHQLASLIGISKMTLYKYENFISEPRATIIRSLADVLDTTSDYLLNRIDNPKPFDKEDVWIRLKPSEAILINKIRSFPPPYQNCIYERMDLLLENAKLNGNKTPGCRIP